MYPMAEETEGSLCSCLTLKRCYEKIGMAMAVQSARIYAIATEQAEKNVRNLQRRLVKAATVRVFKRYEGTDMVIIEILCY